MKIQARQALFVSILLFSTACFAEASETIVVGSSSPPLVEANGLLEQQQKQLRDKAEKAGKAVELTLKLNSEFVSIPLDLVDRVEAYQAAQRKQQICYAAWRKLESEELKRRIKGKNGQTKFWCLTQPGQIVSMQDAIEQLGASPKMEVEVPPTTQTPGGVLEFKNVSDETQQFSLKWENGHGTIGYVTGTNTTNGQKFKAGHLAAKEKSVTLAPGETYELQVFPAASIDLFKEPGEFLVDISMTTGLRYDDIAGQRLLTEDSMVLKSKPATFRVEFE